jgi:hypothetical protein
MPIWSHTLSSLLLFALTLTAHGQAGRPPGGPSSDNIADWINQLNADEYDVRERATGQLIAAGQAAVAPVTAALARSSWEVTTRGIYVLRELALSRSEDTERAALASLRQIATRDDNALARRAGEALVKVEEIRPQRAIQLLKSLGVKIDPEHQERDLYLGSMVELEIGEDWQGEDADLRQLRYLTEVQQVTFVGPQVNDTWMEHLVGMQDLRAIKVKNARISDAATASLKRLGRLQFVKFLYVPLSDASVDNLRACRYMSHMKLYGTNISSQATDLLEQSLGQEVVDVRNGAFLGIGPNEPGADWFIDSVAVGSAAEKAGLRPGDVITKYGGQPVRDFESLTAMIAQNDVHDTVTIHVRRGSRTLELKVTFGEWD